MPKRKRSHRKTPSHAKVSAEEDVNLENEMNVKIEPAIDEDFDPMQSESTKTILLNAINMIATGHAPEIDTIKPEVDVKVEYPFRPEMLENSHEVAYMLRPNTLHSHKKKMPEKIVDKITKPKQKKKSTKRIQQPEYEPVEIEVNGKKMVKCPLCNKKTTKRYRAKIRNHIRHAHTQDTPFKCDYCDSKYSSLSALRSHMESEHNKKKIQCEQCRLIFYESKKLELHKLKCPMSRSSECYMCSFKVNRINMHAIKRHIRKVHTGEKPFDCTICSENFMDKLKLMNHMRRLHPEVMPFKCPMCMKKFQKKEKFQRHEKKCQMRSRFECYVCQYSYPAMTFNNLQSHMRSKHTGERPFQCSLCNKSCSSQQTLVFHLQRHRDTLTLKCVRCHRAFSNGSELTEHQKICQRRRYECHLCGFTKYGLSWQKFIRHMAIHTGVQALKCNGCSNTFRSYINLAEHILKSDHTQLLATICPNCCYHFSSRADRNAHQSKCLRKRFECHLCGKTSKTLNDLHTHITFKHTGLKRFNCKFCSRKFSRKINLEKHVKTHTKVGLIKCQYCAKTFIDMKY